MLQWGIVFVKQLSLDQMAFRVILQVLVWTDINCQVNEGLATGIGNNTNL